MKSKTKQILLLILLGSLIVISYYHKKDIRCLFINQNSGYQQVKERVYVSKDTPQELVDSLLVLLHKSNQELTNFWGNLIATPTIIYCHTSMEYQKFGVPNSFALCRLGEYVICSNSGLRTDIISHEICHSEIFSRIGENYFKYYTKLPCWLDEGIALQFDSRNIYNIDEKQKEVILSKEELENLDRPKKFYSKNLDKTIENYISSKIEIERFIKKNSIQVLIDVLEQFEKSGHLYDEYYKKRAL